MKHTWVKRGQIAGGATVCLHCGLWRKSKNKDSECTQPRALAIASGERPWASLLTSQPQLSR